MLKNIDTILLNGAKLIIEKVYDSIGFNKIEDETLRQLVVARLCQPMSNMATVEYLKSHFDEDVSLNKIYRYLDKLYNTQQELARRISVHLHSLFWEAMLRCYSMMLHRCILRVFKKMYYAHQNSPRMERLLRLRLKVDFIFGIVYYTLFCSTLYFSI